MSVGFGYKANICWELFVTWEMPLDLPTIQSHSMHDVLSTSCDRLPHAFSSQEVLAPQQRCMLSISSMQKRPVRRCVSFLKPEMLSSKLLWCMSINISTSATATVHISTVQGHSLASYSIVPIASMQDTHCFCSRGMALLNCTSLEFLPQAGK